MERQRTNWSRVHRWAPVLTLVLLAALGVEALSRPDAADAEPYHRRVREVAEATRTRISDQIGDWRGAESEPPPEAKRLLRPNAMTSIKYTHASTGETVEFLFVHCKDARDMQGHYPPNCYPANGWQQRSAEPTDWQVNGLKITGMQYRFAYHRPQGTQRMVVNNFFVMPDGQILRRMTGVRAAAADYTMHFFGAAQIQVVTPASISETRRREIFNEIIRPNIELIRTIQGGVNDQDDEADQNE